jgi:hypothetical protein
MGILKPSRARTTSPENAPVNASRTLSMNAPENASENDTQRNIGYDGDKTSGRLSPSEDKQGRPRSALRSPRSHHVGFVSAETGVNEAHQVASEDDVNQNNTYHSLSPVPSSQSLPEVGLAGNSDLNIVCVLNANLNTVPQSSYKESNTKSRDATSRATSLLSTFPLAGTPLYDPTTTDPAINDSSRTVTPHNVTPLSATHAFSSRSVAIGGWPPTPALPSFNSDSYVDMQRVQSNYFDTIPPPQHAGVQQTTDGTASFPTDRPPPQPYTTFLKARPQLGFIQQLKPYNGRLHSDRWLRVALRPFILYAYPAVLWSSAVYSCSVGWLIVLSESVSLVYRSKDTYNFSALSTGLIYISPFVGGVLGTAVAGKVSDVIVRAMARRNGGLYEPEFRLVMALPITITTVIGLMGFGWSAQIHDAWIVPTIFFGVISFGCSLGSTTAITFVVDSYRQYAGEALVTLNFSKNIFHGLVFSLFFASWLEHDGSKSVFIYLGVIQLILMALSIPMYIFGKRARMWTARKNFIESF